MGNGEGSGCISIMAAQNESSPADTERSRQPQTAGVFGPVATTWFGILARRVTLRNPRLETLARVACDQMLFAPVMIGVFLSSMATMEGASAKERLDKTWWPALQTNWMVWPFVQFVNFTFLPLQHRVLFANVISIGWNSYLSWVNSQPHDDDEETKAVPMGL